MHTKFSRTIKKNIKNLLQGHLVQQQKCQIQKSINFQNINQLQLKVEPRIDFLQIHNQSRSYMQQKYFKTVLFASIVILIYQGIANSVLGIISQFTHQKGNDWAGPLSTALLFLGSGLSSLYNKYIGKYPFKYTFFFGAFGFIIFISMSLIFMKIGFSTGVEILIFILSFVGGCICSVFYNSQFNYINYLSQIDKREVKYFAINVGLVQSSNIFGNLLSSFLIQPMGQFLYVIVMDIIIIVTSLFFLLFKDPQRQQLQSIHQNDQSRNFKQNNQTLLSQNTQKEKKLRQKIPSIKTFSTFSFSGIIVAFIYCVLGIVIYRTFEDAMDETQLNYLTFLLFIFQGIGQFLGGLAISLLSKKIKNTPLCIIIVNTLFMISVGIIFLGYKYQNKYFMGFGVILTGFSDCSTFSLSLTIAGIWKQNGITAFNIFQTITVAISAMIAVFVSFQVFIGWLLLFYLWNVIGMYLWHLQTTQKANKTIMQQ